MNPSTHEEAYRGGDILKRMSSMRFVICGCGAVGSNMVGNMIRQGFRNITVVDMDRVEDHNRGTQVWGRRDVGQLKVNAMKNRVFQDMGVTIGTVSSRLTEDNISKILKDADVVIDGFDNTESRRLVTGFCSQNNKNCLHVGLAADYAEVIWNEEYTVPKGSGQDVCEYPLARNTAMIASLIAVEVLIKYLGDGVKKNYTVTLGDLQIQELGR